MQDRTAYLLEHQEHLLRRLKAYVSDYDGVAPDLYEALLQTNEELKNATETKKAK